MAIHRISQLQLPLVMIATGLPQVPALAGDAKSYAERLFESTIIGALTDSEAREAIANRARDLGVEYTDEALTEMISVTEGYPYFIQEWALPCMESSGIVADHYRRCSHGRRSRNPKTR